MEWSIRTLLNPVIVRSLIYGVNPIDMEYVLQKVEKEPLVNPKALETAWKEEWGKKAHRFSAFGKDAKEKGNYISAREYYSLAAKCYYACYLINSDQIAEKREIYKKLEGYYLQSLQCSDRRFEQVVVKIEDKKGMPGYLHLPEEKKFAPPYACVALFAGMGSSKEELETMASPLVERGIAVLCLDQPGTGAALFDYDLKLSGQNLEIGFDKTMEFLRAHPLLDEKRLGSCGLCMGGGYAYRFAVKYPSVRCVVNLFPLFITMLEKNAVPRWMKQGQWVNYQTIGDETEFYEGMKVLTEGATSSNYLVVHSRYENWMPQSKIKEILDKSLGSKATIVIDEEPAFATKEAIMHAMPVGEQMHWVRIKIADWMVKQLEQAPEELKDYAAK